MAITDVGNGAILLRLVHVLGILGGRGVLLCWLYLRHGRHTRCGRTRFDLELDTWLADTVVAIGPAFVKAAQLLSTRADVLPRRTCRALARLYDRVRPDPVDGRIALLAAGLPVVRARLIGSGSIACVYRVRLTDGRDVAVKVRRPGIDRSLTRDLAMVRRLAALMARIPALRGVPVTEIAGQVCDSVHAQLDLVREAEFLSGLRESMRSLPGVTVPVVDRELSTGDVLVMDFVHGLARRRPDELVESDRQRAVLTALRAVYRMLFLDGVVHCDLHPGNLYFRDDGTVVMVDAGFTVRLSDSARERFAAFFYCLSQGDGPACADIVLSTARSTPGADADGFHAELAALVEENTGRPAAEFDLVSFATRLFDLQRRYGFYADPQFVFPILSLLVLEGAVREFHPKVDFQQAAKPFLAIALFEAVLIPTAATEA
jgi:ubiquinone biosynthesis protein